jgi:integrase
VRRRRGNGEGCVRKRADGRWEGRANLPPDAEGRVRRETVYGRTKAEVLEKLLKLRSDGKLGIVPDAERTTVREYLERWLEDVQRPAVAPGTYLLQRGLLRNHILPRLGRYRFDALRPEHVDYLLAELERQGESARLREQVRSVLHRAYAVSVKRRRIHFNPIAATERPRVERKEVKALSAEESRRLLAAAREDRLWPLFALAMTTGMRQGEIFALKWRNVDLARGVVRIVETQRIAIDGTIEDGDTKTEGSRRTVALGGMAIEALTAYRKAQKVTPLPTALVFTSPEGGRLRKQNFTRRVWRPLLERAGLQAPSAPRLKVPRRCPGEGPAPKRPYVARPSAVKFHAATRHTMATLALEAGVHPKIVQERLGHTRIATTLDTYSHVAPELQRGAADLLDAALAPR